MNKNRDPIKEGRLKTIFELTDKKVKDVRFIGVGKGFKLHFSIANDHYVLVKSDDTERVFVTESTALRFSKAVLEADLVIFDTSEWDPDAVYDYYREHKGKGK